MCVYRYVYAYFYTYTQFKQLKIEGLRNQCTSFLWKLVSLAEFYKGA